MVVVRYIGKLSADRQTQLLYDIVLLITVHADVL